MFEYLKFLESEMLALRSISVKISCSDGKLSYEYRRLEKLNSKERKGVLVGKEAEAFLKKLENLHIEDWGSYPTTFCVMDGPSWDIDYKEKGRRKLHFDCFRVQPVNLTEFYELMDSLV